MIGNSLHYAAGLDTPENKAFTTRSRASTSGCPSWFAESAYTAGLWTKTAIDSINGNVEDRAAFLKAMRTCRSRRRAGRSSSTPTTTRSRTSTSRASRRSSTRSWARCWSTCRSRPTPTVSQFWTWTPEEFLKRGPYKR